MNRGKRGQTIGEYAILFAIVLGAVVAMQTYVRERIAGGIADQAIDYLATATENSGSRLEVEQTTTSVQTATAQMETPGKGWIKSDSQATQSVANPGK